METANERRKRKLDWLCKKHGLAVVAEKSGLADAYLDQILKGALLPKKADGTRSARSLGDSAARAIEDAMHLGEGWFDAPEKPPRWDAETIAFADKYQHMQPYQRAILHDLYAVVHKTPPPTIDRADFQGGLDTGYGTQELKPTGGKDSQK